MIGGSGAGKTTLVKILAGVSRPSEGAVLVNGDDISLHRLPSVGYVPQDEIVHGKLTVREALRYSARLRLPEDTTAAEIDETCARVIAELGLEEHAGTRMERLSGGQRKRVGRRPRVAQPPEPAVPGRADHGARSRVSRRA